MIVSGESFWENFIYYHKADCTLVFYIILHSFFFFLTRVLEWVSSVGWELFVISRVLVCAQDTLICGSLETGVRLHDPPGRDPAHRMHEVERQHSGNKRGRRWWEPAAASEKLLCAAQMGGSDLKTE